MVSFLMFSCEDMLQTVVNIDIPPHDPVLVLNSVLSSEQEISVLISSSVGAFEQTIPSCVNDAEVFIYENNVFLDTLLIDLENTDSTFLYTNMGQSMIPMNLYKSDIIPNSGSTYTVIVNHPDYDNISATTYIPEDIVVTNIQVDTVTSIEKIGFSFVFNDDAVQQNYYRLKLFSSCVKTYLDEYGDTMEYSFGERIDMMSNDPSFPGEIPFEGYTFYGNQVVFSDDLFNGQTKNILIDVESEGFQYSDCDTVAIQFSTFSNDTYSYYNSLNSHEEKGVLGVFGGEVVPVYSNVQSGLGALISVNAQNIYLKP